MILKATDKRSQGKLLKVQKKMVIPSFSLNRKKAKYVEQVVIQLIAKSIDHLAFSFLTIEVSDFRILLMEVYHIDNRSSILYKKFKIYFDLTL